MSSVIWHLSFSIWRQYDITVTYLRLHVWAASYDTCLSLSDVRTTSLLLTWDSTYKQRHMTPVFLYLTSERHHCYLLETPCMSSVIWHLSFSIRRQRRRQRQRQRQPLGPATLLRMELLRSLSWLSNIPLHVCVTSLSTCACRHAQSLRSCPTLSNPLSCSLPDSSVHWIFPGKNTGVGCHFLLHGIFPTNRGIKPASLVFPAL